VAFGRPIYVVDIDSQANRVTLGERQSLRRGGLTAREVNWLTDRPPIAGQPISCLAKIRYNHDPQAASVTAGDGEIVVRFDEPQSAVTPGQAVVLYDGDVVLGGGWIERALE
jgi:tRNA-specific 2-thiouridylase